MKIFLKKIVNIIENDYIYIQGLIINLSFFEQLKILT